MIRKYQDDDTDAIIDVWFKATRLAHPFLSEDFLAEEVQNIRKIYLPNTETWVLEDGGHLVGFISLIHHGRGDIEVGAIFLDPARHGCGLGKALMDRAVTLHRRLKVDVFKDNKIGRRFYDGYGFIFSHEYVFERTGDAVLQLTYGI